MNLQLSQWTTSVIEITWYQKLMPVKNFCLGKLADCNREVKADVKSTLCHDQTPAAAINLCVYRMVCLRMNLSSSCQAWCLTTSEWVNNHCYLLVLSTHFIDIVTDLASSSWGDSKFGGNPPQMCLDKTLCECDSIYLFGYRYLDRRRWHRSAWNFAWWYISARPRHSLPFRGQYPQGSPKSHILAF